MAGGKSSRYSVHPFQVFYCTVITMKLISNRIYKSVARFTSIDLPTFTVLTGVNGAGKSHLLEAIEVNAVSVEGIAPNQPSGPTSIRRFDWSTLVPQDTGPFSAAQISTEQVNLWNEVSQHRHHLLVAHQDRINQLNIPALEKLNIKALRALREPDLIELGVAHGMASGVINTIQHSIDSSNQQFMQMFLMNDPQNRRRLLSKFSEAEPISFLAMDQDDFYRAYPKTWQPVDLFQQSFARLFSAYQRHWAQNKLKTIGAADGADVIPLSDNEFLAKHGQAPWDFLNEVLEAAELDFRINAPYKWDDRPYEPILTDIKRDIRIKFADLSSGEKVLMSFALCLYHASDPDSSRDFPKVLLFDEIDAPLHPSMTRSLLRTIHLTLVEKHQINVILTTHSPSTVALAPESSIHVMRKHGADRLERTTKDIALGILTAGVPTLSVNHENRRQIFVESKHDVEYYGGLYQRCKSYLSPDVSLVFIASGSSGNCTQVESVVNKLVAGGNRTTLGVIDWDLKNTSSDSTIVVGQNERYSIENFLLDPVLLGLLLLREKAFSPELFGLPLNFRYTDAMTLSHTYLQGLADRVITDVASTSIFPNDHSFVNFHYLNDMYISAPKWLAHMQGHLLETKLKEAYPRLNRYQKEPDLKMEIITKVVDDFPQITPLSIVTLFRRLQSGPVFSA